MWLSTLVNYLLVELSLHWDFDHEWVKELNLLVTRLVAEASFQLGLLFTGTILGPKIGKTVWANWIVQIGNLEDNQSLW